MKEGWKMVKLGEVFKLQSGENLPAKHMQKGKYPVYGGNGISGYHNAYNMIGDNIIIGRVGALCGNARYITEPFWLTDNGFRVILNTEYKIDYKYLTCYLNFANLRQYAKQTAQPVISNVALKEVDIILPPLEEQHRIVSILDESFEKIDALKKNAEENLKNAKALFQQVLAQELKPKEGWVEKKLGEIGVGKLTYGSATPAQDYDGAVRYVRITDIDDNGNLSNERKSPSTIDAKYFLNEGDLLFARTGATVGKTYLYKKSDGRCLYAGYLIRLKVNKDVVNPLFVFHCTKTSTYWDFIKKSQRTAAQPNINAEQYSNYTISFPPSIEEQHRIVHTLDILSEKCRRLEQIAQQTIRECDALKQSILRQAFSGKL